MGGGGAKEEEKGRKRERAKIERFSFFIFLIRVGKIARDFTSCF